jgi:deazaflavin-dependent oxidoreductase (nitroreductase family)
MTPTVRASTPARRPLLGLRRRPGRLVLVVFRMPLRAYRHGAGWLLGRTFLQFTHIGRRTGRPHDAVAMVLGFDEGTRECVICACWGPETDWYRNLRAGPAANVRIGRDSFTPDTRFLTDEEAAQAAFAFRRAHPHQLRLMGAIMGWPDLRDDDVVRAYVRTHPYVAFRPAQAVAPDRRSA